MMQQIHAEAWDEVKGKTVLCLFWDYVYEMHIILFTDKTFICLGSEMQSDDWVERKVVEVTPESATERMVDYGLFTKEEVQAAREAKQKKQQRQQEEKDRRELQRLKAKYEGGS